MQNRNRIGFARRGTISVFLLILISILGRAYFAPPDHSRSGSRGTSSPTTSVSQPIEITDGALQHIRDRHTVGGTMTAGKSVFNGREDIQALVKYAESVIPDPQENGNYQRVVNAGRAIGFDRRTGQQTSTYTVITTEAGELVTAFPGLP